MDNDPRHPLSLRPGGPSQSISPNPEQQAEMSRKPVASATPSSQWTSYGQAQPTQASNYSGRFPSNQYPQETFPIPAQTNQSQTPEARSRSSTQTSPQRSNPGLAPSAYHASRPSSSSVNNPTANHAKQLSSPTLQTQSLYSRPASSSASGNTTRSVSQPPGQFQPQSTGAGPLPSQSQFTTTISAPQRPRPIQILLVNPNSTRSMTEACLASVRPKLPYNVELTGYTAPHPAPSAIESTTDAILSAEACIRDLAQHSASNNETIKNFDGILVACFSKHPLIDALRELYDVPVIGIMEASLYVARMLGGRFGIIATSRRSKILQDDAVAGYGLSHSDVGSESTHLGVLELESKPREEVVKRVGAAAQRLVIKGADVVILGCAGMTTDTIARAAKDAVRDEDGRRLVNVVDGVEAGVWMLNGLAGMGCPTSKKGMFASAGDARRVRGQEWL